MPVATARTDRVTRTERIVRFAASLEQTAGRATKLQSLQLSSCVLCCLAYGCSGPQSALDPSGPKSEAIAALFWMMTIAGSVIFVAFVALALYAVYFRRRQYSLVFARRLIVIGSVAIPTVLLAALLVYGLRVLPEHLAPAPQGSLRVYVSGHQWWWRIRYESENDGSFETANELRLAVNRPVQFVLDSPDVIHSFWIPNLAGKVDMIPGRVTRLALTPTRTGDYRGQCAEYCGTSHAWMAFAVVVLEQTAFDAWLKEQAASARDTGGELALSGKGAFVESGCGACHTVRGTSARGAIGPDLTHVGSRRSIGAGLFTRNTDAFERWVRSSSSVKPGVHMPAFGMLPEPTLRAIATYLESLK
jgi:cytochrome c oxidase subunit II